MEIIEGIHRVDEASANMAHANVYLLINGKELTVIDTGTSGNAQKTVEYIQKLGYQPTDVKTIILTHFHMDHMGSAKELKDLTNAKVAVHTEDADYVSGKKPLPKPKNILFRAVSSFVKPVPVQVDVILKEGDKIAGLVVIHTPGHTPGSIMLLDEERKVLFAGDTLRYDGKKVSGAPEQFSTDPNQIRESIAKASTLNFDVMLPGHGETLKPNASEEIKKFNETLKQK
ncbi:MAG: MBL fold metallo-hydrolase [Candidatus Bathyarchaeia archaeon]|jgi:glyoxylase-like metal-dependent hydrolase (beta-lactamase superfamily II)